MAKQRTKADARPHHLISGLEITGGFLKGLKLEFADGLNCIIGGRGTGKTTVLEFVRYVLGLMPDPKTTPARSRAIQGVVQTNLANGKIKIAVKTKHGIGYNAERPWNDACQVLDEKGVATAITLDRDLIFRADVYSQNEIEEIATTPALQLALLDKFVAEDMRRVESETRKVTRELAENASELLRLGREASELGDTASESAILEEKLKALQETEGPDAKKINAAHSQKALREKERKTLELLKGDVAKIVAELEAALGPVAPRLRARLDPELLNGPNKKIFQSVAHSVGGIAEEVKTFARALRKAGEESVSVINDQAQALAETHAKQEQEYRSVVVRSDEARERAAERSHLQERHVEATTAAKELQARRTEAKRHLEKRRDLVARLSALRDERFRLRKSVADRLSSELDPMIRVAVRQEGGRDTYRELLTEALKGSGFKHAVVVDKLVQSVSPDELTTLVQKDELARLAERAGLDAERTRKIVDSLRNTEVLYRIETVEHEDVPCIELLDGETYKDSASLSTGQRCTTILPILLLESERPLLVDQPEDNLDNRFIFETVVKIVRGAKGSRQLIFVTHNPNIPVLGDADRIFVMTSNGQNGSLKFSGTVDELKGEIETLLEGGSEAFLLRKERYGH
jgi:ABC-type lipoprotein export system ATPase subunit